MSKHTKESYELFEKVLSKVLDIEWTTMDSKEKEDVLGNHENVIDKFKTYIMKDQKGIETGKNYSDNSLRNWFTKIHVIIKNNPEWNIGESDKEYVKEFTELNKKLAKNIGENKKSEKQEKNWVEWPEVLELRRKLKDEIKNTVDAFRWSAYQNYLIISLYTYRPPVRIDYIDMKIIKNTVENMSTEYNYVVLKEKIFIFNNYKTNYCNGANEKRQVIKPIPKKLLKIIKIWVKIYKPDFVSTKDMLDDPETLLVTEKGRPMERTSFIARMKRIFRVNGYPEATINILRHSYIKYANEKGELDTMNKRKNLASDMMHSVVEQLEYYKY